MADSSVYTCTLDKSSLKKAKDELFENPEDRLAAVEALRDWITAQPHIKCPKIDTITLLLFLRWAKFSQVRARERFEGYLSLRNFENFSNIDVNNELTRKIILDGYVLIPPTRLPDGTQLMILSLDKMGKYAFQDLLKASSIAMEYCCQSEMSQVNGFTFLIDYTGFKWKYMEQLMPNTSQKIIKAWMNNMPGRWKKVFWYRPGLLMEALITFFKPIFPKKLISRISAHETMESIYSLIPKECLPAEYLPDDYSGPSVGTKSQCAEKLWKDASEKQFRESLLYKTSDAFGVDVSKKPVENVTQHFRKLNVD